MGVSGTGINFPTTARGQLKNRKKDSRRGVNSVSSWNKLKNQKTRQKKITQTVS
jgi:hypothetical protein